LFSRGDPLYIEAGSQRFRKRPGKAEMENAHIAMVRADLEGVPQVELPPPFSLRRYRPGDEAAWMRIHLAAD